MSDIMRPMPFAQLMDWILSEYAEQGSIFGESRIVKKRTGHARPIFDEKIETPYGPAAGPNTQLAQNIVASYVTGARFFELKTVQKMDGAELSACVNKPCILASDEGYNCEWSTELTVHDVNNLLVNLDELEAIRPSQHAALKQTLSKSKVNGRPIYGKAQDDRLRYASFVATTNNPHPLTDATGSRRYICLTIPRRQFIDNSGDIHYDQLYAQVVHEIRQLKAPYWFNNSEVERLQQLNLGYVQSKDMAQMVRACFRKPEEGEHARAVNSSEMLGVILKEYPAVPATHNSKVQIGLAMKELGFEGCNHSHVKYYYAVPRKTA